MNTGPSPNVTPILEGVRAYIQDAVLPLDFLLAEMYMNARTPRLADGQDEVHRMVVARHELRPWLKRTKK